MSYKSYINHLSNRILIIAYIRIHSANNTSITDFTDGDGNDRMKETVQANYRRIKEEVKQIVQEELERIANDENLKHLLQQK